MPSAKNPVVRLKPQTFRYLQRRSKAEGKPIGRLIDEAIRPRRSVDAAAVLERIEDLLDARDLATAIDDPNQEWVSLEELDKDLGLKWKPRKRRQA